jgi:glutathione S-transferase
MRLPTWQALAAVLPSANHPGPAVSDWLLAPPSVFSSSRPTLFRERNGWDPYSARVWLSLELKGVEYDTVRIDTSFQGRPGMLSDSTPQIMWPDGHLMAGSLNILLKLDELYPCTTIAPSSRHAMMSAEPERLARAYHTTFPGGTNADEDNAPMRLAASRADFEAAASSANALLGEHADGPFFCGAQLSAADLAWTPFLERYAAWLPLLHPGFDLERDARWPHLSRWFEAMAAQPAYSARLRGDPSSWRKVLAFSPGWLIPPSRGWSPPMTRGHAAAERREVSAPLWAEYTRTRPHVAAGGAAEEAAAHIVRHREAIARDARLGLGLASEDALDAPLRALAWALLLQQQGADGGAMASRSDEEERAACHGTPGLRELAAYLEERVCVPRDMGAPAAAALTRVAVGVGSLS